jgi:hypothetical protein
MYFFMICCISYFAAARDAGATRLVAERLKCSGLSYV